MARAEALGLENSADGWGTMAKMGGRNETPK